jgi:hypothetical protein
LGQVKNRTQGVLSWTEKNGRIKFIEGISSGKANASRMLESILERMFKPDSMDNWHHVETQSIALMRKLRIRNATLAINNPKGVCELCAGMEIRLPRGFTLTITDPGGAVIAILKGQGVRR